MYTSKPSDKPSPSLSGCKGSVPFVISIPSNKPSLSESGLLTKVALGIRLSSFSFDIPSRSKSLVEVPGAVGSLGLVSKNLTSRPSRKPSPSVSTLFGSVPANCSSKSERPSRSLSTALGLLRLAILSGKSSFKSLKPSPSMSSGLPSLSAEHAGSYLKWSSLFNTLSPSLSSPSSTVALTTLIPT